jgi:hypothetical protein
MKFRVKKQCGNHNHNGTIYGPGDIFESDRDETKRFRNKFERVLTEDEVMPAKPNITVPKKKRSAKKEEVEEISDASTSSEVEDVEELDLEEEVVEEEDEPQDNRPDGKDVTEDYPTAVELEVEVFQKGIWHVVYDPADDEILSKKKLRAKQVQPFLEKYLD